MIRVYLEKQGSYAQEIAIFADEDVYEKCLPALEAYAKAYDPNFIITESVTDEVFPSEENLRED